MVIREQPSRPHIDIPRAFLIGRSPGTSDLVIALDSTPLTIGPLPTCDLIMETDLSGEEQEPGGRIWQQADRFFLHVREDARHIRVNGELLPWAVLEDGDELQIAGQCFRFTPQS